MHVHGRCNVISPAVQQYNENRTCTYGGTAFSDAFAMVFWCRDAIGRLGSGSTIFSGDNLHVTVSATPRFIHMFAPANQK